MKFNRDFSPYTFLVFATKVRTRIDVDQRPTGPVLFIDEIFFFLLTMIFKK